MSSITRTSNSRIKQIANLSPYILLAISLVACLSNFIEASFKSIDWPAQSAYTRLSPPQKASRS
jgi:hypothetical protein